MRDHSDSSHRARALMSALLFVPALLLVVVVLAFSGCDSTPDYPAHLSFPTRKDRLVMKVPDARPPEPSGQLEADLEALDSRGGSTISPSSLSAETQGQLDRILRETFGTPAAPQIQLMDDAEAASSVERLGLSAPRLAEGGKLFRKHCLSCHGMTGDGRGQAGVFLNPYPRDFRRGCFKFVSTGEGMKPRRTDLLRTIREGLPPMQSFSLLPEEERELLTGYATYLSIRGQVEFQTLSAAVLLNVNVELEPRVRKELKQTLGEWDKAEQAPPLPAAPEDGEPASETHQAAVRRGYELFAAKTGTECLKCHEDFGRKPVPRYTVWGTVATPANFTATTLRGGTRPQDVYSRIRFGIAPVGMPGHPKLSERQVWDLVRFVRSAPYPRELPEDIRAIVYSK